MYMRNLKKKMKTQRIRVKHLHAKLDTKSSKLQKNMWQDKWGWARIDNHEKETRKIRISFNLLIEISLSFQSPSLVIRRMFFPPCFIQEDIFAGRVLSPAFRGKTRKVSGIYTVAYLGWCVLNSLIKHHHFAYCINFLLLL